MRFQLLASFLLVGRMQWSALYTVQVLAFVWFGLSYVCKVEMCQTGKWYVYLSTHRTTLACYWCRGSLHTVRPQKRQSITLWPSVLMIYSVHQSYEGYEERHNDSQSIKSNSQGLRISPSSCERNSIPFLAGHCRWVETQECQAHARAACQQHLRQDAAQLQRAHACRV